MKREHFGKVVEEALDSLPQGFCSCIRSAAENPVRRIEKVHHFRSRIAVPAPNRVNLPSGKRPKWLTFAPRWPTLRPSPRVGIYPQPVYFEAVISQMWPNSALHVGLAEPPPATCASFLDVHWSFSAGVIDIVASAFLTGFSYFRRQASSRAPAA